MIRKGLSCLQDASRIGKGPLSSVCGPGHPQLVINGVAWRKPRPVSTTMEFTCQFDVHVPLANDSLCFGAV